MNARVGATGRSWTAQRWRRPRSTRPVAQLGRSSRPVRVAAAYTARDADDDISEDDFAVPGGDPKVMKEVCDKLFPPHETDWEEFWSKDDYEAWYPKFVEAFNEAGGYDPLDPEREPTNAEQMEWLTRATDYLRTREDFMEFLPFGWDLDTADEHLFVGGPDDEEELDILGDEEDSPWNRDMDAWDLRAVMEKRRYREASRIEWRRHQAHMGTWPQLDVLKDDVRFTDEDREMFEMTDEEAWHYITQGGKAADPKEVLKHTTVCDPNEKVDFPAIGVRYIEEVDEFLKRKGHWTERESDLTSKNFELEGDDFDKYEEALHRTAGNFPEGSKIDLEPEIDEDNYDT